MHEGLDLCHLGATSKEGGIVDWGQSLARNVTVPFTDKGGIPKLSFLGSLYVSSQLFIISMICI